jgi:hypothetical protein
MDEGDNRLGEADLERLLSLAHKVVTWTTQDTIRHGAAGTPALIRARQDYYRGRLEAYARVRPLGITDTGGCTCREYPPGPDCMYHYAARLQPDNHRIPANCPTYYDGCNCKAGLEPGRDPHVESFPPGWKKEEEPG